MYMYMYIYIYMPKKTKMDPEHDGLEKGCSFQLWGFLVSMLVLEGT